MNAFSHMSPADLLVAAGYEHGEPVSERDSARRPIFDTVTGEEVAQLAFWQVCGWLASRGELRGPWTPWQAEMVRRYEELVGEVFPGNAGDGAGTPGRGRPAPRVASGAGRSRGLRTRSAP